MAAIYSTAARPQIKPPPPPKREQVLIVVHGDGMLEAYAEKHIDFRFIMAPYIGTAAGEIAAEQYIESIIPQCYRDVYWPCNKRAAAMIQRIKPSDIVRRNGNMELLRSIERAGAILADDWGAA